MILIDKRIAQQTITILYLSLVCLLICLGILLYRLFNFNFYISLPNDKNNKFYWFIREMWIWFQSTFYCPLSLWRRDCYWQMWTYLYEDSRSAQRRESKWLGSNIETTIPSPITLPHHPSKKIHHRYQSCWLCYNNHECVCVRACLQIFANIPSPSTHCPPRSPRKKLLRRQGVMGRGRKKGLSYISLHTFLYYK